MRILQVTPYFAPAWAYGGPPYVVYQLSRALVDRGHNVSILTTDALSRTQRQKPATSWDGLDVHYLRNTSNFLAWNQQIFLPMRTDAFLRENLRDVDIIHLHMFRTYQNVITRKRALEAGVPYVISGHGSVPRIVRMRLAKSVFDAIIGRQILMNATKLVAVSEAEKRQYESQGIPDSRISVVHNGILAADYRNLPPYGRFVEKYGFKGRTIIAYVGRIDARKGLELLIRAFGRMSERRRDIALVLVGPDSGYQRHLERIAKKFDRGGPIVFTGFISMENKLQVLVDSSVVVYPGSYEVFGLVPFEALLCGTPVVVANDSGCGEIVGRVRAGWTYPYGDENRLGTAIENAITDHDQAEEMVARGRKFVLQELSWERIARQMEDLYLAAWNGSGDA